MSVSGRSSAANDSEADEFRREMGFGRHSDAEERTVPALAVPTATAVAQPSAGSPASGASGTAPSSKSPRMSILDKIALMRDSLRASYQHEEEQQQQQQQQPQQQQLQPEHAPAVHEKSPRGKADKLKAEDKSPRRLSTTTFFTTRRKNQQQAAAASSDSADHSPRGSSGGSLPMASVSSGGSPRGSNSGGAHANSSSPPNLTGGRPLHVPSLPVLSSAQTSGVGDSDAAGARVGLSRSSRANKSPRSTHSDAAAISRRAGVRRSKSVNSMLHDEEGSMNVPGLFGMPLAELLAKDVSDKRAVGEKEWAVPYVMHFLLEGVTESGGFTTEGIFRLSVGTVVKQAAMQQLHQFDYTSFGMQDPHLYCVLLKEWFKLLPQPLIANYEAGLALGMEKTPLDTDAAIDKLWMEMSPSSRAVLRRLMLFISDAVVHEKETRMNATNLCIVFAPGILRSLKEQSALDMLRDQPITHRALMKIFDWVVRKLPKETANETHRPQDRGGGGEGNSNNIAATAAAAEEASKKK